MYEYRCVVKRVVDGDTVDIDIDLGFDVHLRKERVRIYGIDCEESRTRDKEEKKYGLAAKKFVKDFLSDGIVTLVTKKYDAKGKFGRILGDFHVMDKDGNERVLSSAMILTHHAVLYEGQNKEDIREAHLANRKFINVE
mgnify:CR=1 FL=1